MLESKNMVSALERWTFEGDQTTETYIYAKDIPNTQTLC